MTTPNGKREFEAALELLEAHWVQESLAYGDSVHAESFKAAIAALKNYDSLRIELAHTKERAKSLEAEVELDKMLIADLTKDMNEYHDKAEKAEAELARWKPLIEAARGVDKENAEWNMAEAFSQGREHVEMMAPYREDHNLGDYNRAENELNAMVAAIPEP